MNFFHLFVVILFTALTNGDHAPERYTVNLDLPEEERWVDIFTKNKLLFRNNINSALGIVLEDLLPMKEELEPFLIDLANKLEYELPRPGCNEIKGMAKALDIDMGILVLENLLYDFTAFKKSSLLKKNSGVCTSIVAEDKNGTIWHARNLDYGAINEVLSEVLKNLTIEVDFVRNGKIQYTATTYAGLTGLFTAQKPFQYSVTLDERDEGNGAENILVALLEKNVSFSSQMIRKTFEETSSFEEAVAMLSSAVTPAPSYLIIGGTHPGEGAIITRNRIEKADVWYLNQTKDKWFLVETNYDHWVPAPKSDDRRDVAIQMMDQIGQGHVNKESLFKVLSTNPVYNTETTYTTVMSARQPNIYQTWIRDKN